jgi:hypothetical protein
MLGTDGVREWNCQQGLANLVCNLNDCVTISLRLIGPEFSGHLQGERVSRLKGRQVRAVRINIEILSLRAVSNTKSH